MSFGPTRTRVDPFLKTREPSCGFGVYRVHTSLRVLGVELFTGYGRLGKFVWVFFGLLFGPYGASFGGGTF